MVHSFWVPRLAGKTDLIPNKINSMWIEPERTGLFLGQCAKYCGTQHAKMLLRVYVDTPEDFDRWVREQRKSAQTDPTVAAGRRVFEQTACINCHAVRGTVGDGRFGPDLTHLMSRDTLASGALGNSPDMLRAWIKAPDALKPGVLMPAMNLKRRRFGSTGGLPYDTQMNDACKHRGNRRRDGGGRTAPRLTRRFSTTSTPGW